MTYLLLALLVPLVCLAAGYALAALEPTDPAPPRVTDRRSVGPLHGVLHPPAGKERELQAAPHRGRLIAWSGSIWRSR